MRLRVWRDAILSPCLQTDQGKVEDYTITITDNGGCDENYFGGGCGTPENPYLIYTSEQMQDVGKHNWHWSRHFELMADIDLGGYPGETFNVIGNVDTHFTGITEVREILSVLTVSI